MAITQIEFDAGLIYLFWPAWRAGQAIGPGNSREPG